jgi:hypothetical protein
VIGEIIYHISIFRLVFKLLSVAAQGIGYTSDSVKVKVKFSPCLINSARRHEDVWGSVDPTFLISAFDGSEWATSSPCRMTSVGKTTGVEERKISFSYRESNPGVQP